ncbi:MAG: DUF4290 domain-containing protein [Alloprevotella sp.]|nr:DUF4290 domain-containing protein [Alloprevotella sp.]
MDNLKQKEGLRLTEYGRIIQHLCLKALEESDRDRRALYCDKIVQIMVRLNPQIRNTASFKQKLWNHLAYISDYKMDIDYPVEIFEQSSFARPNTLPYPQNNIRYRQYGRIVQDFIRQLQLETEIAKPEGIKQRLLAKMRHDLLTQKGTNASVERLENDYAELLQA